MKRTLILLAIALAACRPAGTSTPTREGAKEGEFCGGIAGILCEEGLTCQYEGTYPDAGGTCVLE